MDYSQLRGHSVIEVVNTVTDLPAGASDGELYNVVGVGLKVRTSNAWSDVGTSQATATALAIALG